MTLRSKATLRSWFLTGDIPTQSQFADFIQTCVTYNTIARTALQTLISVSLIDYPSQYEITNGVSSTIRVLVLGLSASTISTIAYDLTGNRFGYYDITTDIFYSVSEGIPDSVTTTNNTATTISTIPIASNKGISIRCLIRGVRTGGTGGSAIDSVYIIYDALFVNIAGTLSKVGETLTVSFASNSNCTISSAISGTNVLIKVIGDTNNNYSWQNFKTLNLL